MTTTETAAVARISIPTFGALGTRVTWTSHANGNFTTKTGNIWWILPPGISMARALQVGREQKLDVSILLRARASVRRRTSYIIKVGNKLYWPLVCHLSAI